MKRIMIFLIMIMGIYSAHAYTICAKLNTYVGVVRKGVNGTVANVTNTASKKQWAVEYDYKTITGYAACNEISGTFATPQTNLYTNAGDAGQYCWCEMWPIYDDDDTTNYHYETGITSYWVFLHDYTTSSSCASSCASACANAMALNHNSSLSPAGATNSSGFRHAVFESVW